jgi:class 3 adenylate cyclase
MSQIVHAAIAVIFVLLYEQSQLDEGERGNAKSVMLMLALTRFAVIYALTFGALQHDRRDIKSGGAARRLIHTSAWTLAVGAVCILAAWAVAREHVDVFTSPAFLVELCMLLAIVGFVLQLYARTIRAHALRLRTAHGELRVLGNIKTEHHQLLFLLRKVLPHRTVAHLLAQQEQKRNEERIEEERIEEERIEAGKRSSGSGRSGSLDRPSPPSAYTVSPPSGSRALHGFGDSTVNLSADVQNANPLVERFEHVTILFLALPGLASWTRKISTSMAVKLFNELICRLDDEIVALSLNGSNVEKIRVDFGKYVVATGLPDPDPTNHAPAMAEVAMRLIEVVAKFSDDIGTKLLPKIGIATGDVVAGVLGASRYQYDLIGDAANVAARMCGLGAEGRIQVTIVYSVSTALPSPVIRSSASQPCEVSPCISDPPSATAYAQ